MISIILVTYNRPYFLLQAIQSIVSQTYKKWELIVIDDGSDCENTIKSLVKSFQDERIIYHRIKHSGIPKARNIGTKLAKYDIIAVADDDDVYFPYWIEKQMEKIKKNDLVYGTFIIKDEGIYVAEPFSFGKLIWGERTWTHSALMVKKKLLEKYKYDENYSYGTDYKLMLQLAEQAYKGKYKFGYVKEPLVLINCHSGSVTNTHHEEQHKTTDLARAETIAKLSEVEKQNLKKELDG